jgi:uncharacterized phage-associated protein
MFRFDAKKAVQAASVLLDVEGGRMSYFRLLKLLYIADRQSMKETGFPITLSHASALPHGPVPSEIYDLVKGSRTDAKDWSTFIRTQGYQVSAIPGTDPGRGKLSRYEIYKLRDVAEMHEPFGDWEIAEITHAFDEFVKHDPGHAGSNPIPLSDVLDAVGMGDNKAAILGELRNKGMVDELVAAYRH